MKKEIKVSKKEKPMILKKFSKKTIDLKNKKIKEDHLEILYQNKEEFGKGIIKIEKYKIGEHNIDCTCDKCNNEQTEYNKKTNWGIKPKGE
jgi:hypothetical protein